jgi:prepilin-type processing-associated H-X9-DG protein
LAELRLSQHVLLYLSSTTWGDFMRIERPAHRAFCLVELLVVIVILALMLALLGPALHGSREKARRIQCTNQMKQIGLALHNYASAQTNLPPGAIMNTPDVILKEATGEADDEEGHATSFLLRIMPYMEQDQLSRKYNYKHGCLSDTNLEVAKMDIPGLYCPSRRSSVRKDDRVMLYKSAEKGGTDYGGCVGRCYQFDSIATDGSKSKYDDGTKGVAGLKFNGQTAGTTAASMIGVFGDVNHATTFAACRDGTSNIIMTGELQRISNVKSGKFDDTNGKYLSQDGWILCGPATLFSTGVFCEKGEIAEGGAPMNNGHHLSPGSSHPGGANFGFGDGSVRFIVDKVDKTVFALYGSINDGLPVLLE